MAMASKLLQFSLTPWMIIDEYLNGMDLASINVGPSGELYLLTVSKPTKRRSQTKKNVTSAKVRTSDPHNFIVTRFDDSQVASFEIRDQFWNYHNVQPLPDDEFLLVCGRAYYRGPDEFNLNGKVFSQTGDLRREFLLGDGIQDVQTTVDGNIWVSYFDEGVFGNYGWGYGNNPPIGESGLIQWERFGKKLYEYSPPSGLDMISDCYALNVTNNDDIWFYYYTDFPLVRLKGKDDYTYWNIRINSSSNWAIDGSGSFAVMDNRVLFCGGYQQPDKYQFVELMDDHQMKLQATYQFINEQGMIIDNRFAVARDRFLFLMQENRLYRVDLTRL